MAPPQLFIKYKYKYKYKYKNTNTAGLLHPNGGKNAWVELLKPLQYKVDESNDDIKRSEKTQKLISNFYATLL